MGKWSFLGVSKSSSEILSIYTIKEAVPPVIDIVSPWWNYTQPTVFVGPSVYVNVSAYDEHSGVRNVTLLVGYEEEGVMSEVVVDYAETPYRDNYYLLHWDAKNREEGWYYLTIVVYDNANNTEGGSIDVFLDKTPPSLEVTRYPRQVREETIATVSISVSDELSGVSTVILSYSVDGGKTWANVTVTAKSGDVYEAKIPGQPAGTIVQFKVIATDIVGNVAVSPIYSYEVVSEVLVPGLSWNLIIGVGVVVAVVAAIAFIITRRRG